MKIVADIDIPFIQNYFADLGELILKPGRLIERADILDADLLIIRSVTPVNEKLLDGTPIKFVGTVTTGFDHLDTAWLEQAGILWRAAIGYNALPVVDYVVAVLAALQEQRQLLLSPTVRAGVVGVGRIGSRVAECLKLLGFEVFLCDPPRADQEDNFFSAPLSEIAKLDFISLHTPLERGGKYPSYHLLDSTLMSCLNPNAVLLNAGRGEVVDCSALPVWPGEYCFDVWEHEPDINLQILEKAQIATPHLAGYSVQCRYRGINMIYQNLCDLGILRVGKKQIPLLPRNRVSFDNQQLNWREVVLALFNPLTVTESMKKTLLTEKVSLPGTRKCATLFDKLRQQYIGEQIQRHEFAYTSVTQLRLKEQDRYILSQLGITIEE